MYGLTGYKYSPVCLVLLQKCLGWHPNSKRNVLCDHLCEVWLERGLFSYAQELEVQTKLEFSCACAQDHFFPPAVFLLIH